MPADVEQLNICGALLERAESAQAVFEQHHAIDQLGLLGISVQAPPPTSDAKLFKLNNTAKAPALSGRIGNGR